MAEGSAPGGLTAEAFESLALDAGEWLWGTMEGAFNEKATLSQIVVDAIIGMVPLVGDVTAVRDLIAVVLGLANEPKKREDTMQWVLLVVFILALVPVLGGVAKGVGRLTVKAAAEAAQLSTVAAKVAHMQEAAGKIVAFLNRVGVGHAEKFLKELRFADHQAAILRTFDELLSRIERVLQQAKSSMGSVWPASLSDAVERLMEGLSKVKEKAVDAIPDAIKEADSWLKQIQDYVYTGGDATAMAERRWLRAGHDAVTLTEELRLLEGAGATRSTRGGWAANAGMEGADGLKGTPEDLYTVREGHPNLWEAPDKFGKTTSWLIPTFSGKIVNRELLPGETIYRVFGPALEEGVHGVKNRFGSMATGFLDEAAQSPDLRAFWGLYEVPADAETWRKAAAVIDEWNHDGFLVVGEVLEGGAPLRACTGVIAEQAGKQLPQYLPGGGKQAVIEFSRELRLRLNAAGEQVVATGAPVSLTEGGIRWEIRPTGWSDATGVHGYTEIPGPGASRAERLSSTERAPKAAE